MRQYGAIHVVRGDITGIDAEAIVNAANGTLLGGGGVDGAIHKAAGPGLLEECRALNGCSVGEAKITGGYNLKAKFVIHTVGPVWSGGDNNEHELLAACYRSCMKLVNEKKIESVAFPAISTGVYRFPADQAAFIAVTEIKGCLALTKRRPVVWLVAFSDEQYELYMKYLADENTYQKGN